MLIFDLEKFKKKKFPIFKNIRNKELISEMQSSTIKYGKTGEGAVVPTKKILIDANF